MLSGPILPTLLKLALPTMVVLMAQTAVNIAEAYYVGFLGTDALAGVAMVFPVFMLMTMMSNGGSAAGSPPPWRARSAPAARKMPTRWCSTPSCSRSWSARSFTLGTIRGGPMLYRALGGRSRGARRGAAIFQLSVRRRDPGMDRQSAGRGIARLRQCQGARDS